MRVRHMTACVCSFARNNFALSRVEVLPFYRQTVLRHLCVLYVSVALKPGQNVMVRTRTSFLFHCFKCLFVYIW